MKKSFALLLATLMLFAAGCGGSPPPAPVTAPDPAPPAATDPSTPDLADALTLDTIRIAFIYGGDPSDMGFNYRQHQGVLGMIRNLNLRDDQILNTFNITPGSATDTALMESIEWGADMVFGLTFAFEPHFIEAARQHPDVLFFHNTGNQALASGLPNMHNYFGNMSQARYLSGIAAGLRTETNVLGFVAAHPFAEVITGFTAYFLGARSVNPDVRMYVMYTNSWNDPTLEQQVTQALVDRGADVIGQHANSPSTQTAAESAGVWGIGYNNDMLGAAPNAFLTAPMFDWSVYMTMAVESVIAGQPVPNDWIGGLNEGVVVLVDFNPLTIAPGTEEAIASAEAELRAGRNVFTGPIYDINGNQLLAAGEEFVEPLSAPSWTHIIEGIVVVE